MRKFTVLIIAAAICAVILSVSADYFKKKDGSVTDGNICSGAESANEMRPQQSGGSRNASGGFFEGLRGVWLSCYEIKDLAFGKTEDEYRVNVEAVLDRLCEYSFNTVFFQVRAFSDSLYLSELFPASEMLSVDSAGRPVFDAFGIFLECARSRGIAVHAWVNPFRVSYSDDIKKLPKGSPALALYKNNKKSQALLICEKGIYYNPASESARKCVLDGIREILEKYAPDGIHFDDYFYPDCDFDDSLLYGQYRSAGGGMSIQRWRCANVSEFVSSVYSLVKSVGGNDCIFGISPDADIERDRNKYYADVALWCGTEGYIDYIMPQIYFGFENETKPFKSVADDWAKAVKSPNVKLYAGLAAYKCGLTDKNAGTGRNEWAVNSDILARQASYLAENGLYKGFCLFSYSYSFGKNAGNNSEKELKKLSFMLK